MLAQIAIFVVEALMGNSVQSWPIPPVFCSRSMKGESKNSNRLFTLVHTANFFSGVLANLWVFKCFLEFLLKCTIQVILGHWVESGSSLSEHFASK